MLLFLKCQLAHRGAARSQVGFQARTQAALLVQLRLRCNAAWPSINSHAVELPLKVLRKCV